MNILVINGSPKGKNSITLQTVNYLSILYPAHTFDILHAGQKIKSLERDFTPAAEALKRADMLLFCYPVYTFIAPYQLHRFIELIKESGVSLAGKSASQITTSKHFYDVTAHRYIEDNCHDLGLGYIRGLSADMDDLTTERGRREAQEFFEYLMFCAETRIFENRVYHCTEPRHIPVSIPKDGNASKPGDVVVLTNFTGDDIQLKRMIARFRAVMPRKTRVINIARYPFKGGCLGCFNCAVDGKCIYKDGFDTFLRERVQSAEAMVLAFSIKDHSMGASFKLYDDRQFCNGHRTVTMGMPMGYIISGNLSEEENVRTVIEARAEVGSNFLAGVAGDEVDPNKEIDALAEKLEYALEHKYVPPQNFYGVGGMKIFRDLIWQMQGMMKADHKFYKEHGQYDFPQKNCGRMLAMYLVGAMLASPTIKSRLGGKMTEGMLMPYTKVLDEARKRK